VGGGGEEGGCCVQVGGFGIWMKHLQTFIFYFF
jgi:hypothetical protein